MIPINVCIVHIHRLFHEQDFLFYFLNKRLAFPLIKKTIEGFEKCQSLGTDKNTIAFYHCSAFKHTIGTRHYKLYLVLLTFITYFFKIITLGYFVYFH